VNADAHRQRRAPAGGHDRDVAQAPLDLRGANDGVLRLREGGHERVAVRLYLEAAMRSEYPTDFRVVGLENLGAISVIAVDLAVRGNERVAQRGRADDVGEHQRDVAGGRFDGVRSR